METDLEAEEISQRPVWRRKLIIVLGVMLALLAVLYLVMSSGAFFKSFILPRLGQSLSADIQAGSASIKPFSQVVLRKVVVKTTGSEPLLAAEEVRARYSLMSILRGNIQVHEVTLLSPDVYVVQESSGRSNLDPILSGPSKASSPTGSAKTLQLSIHNVSLKNGRVRFSQKDKAGVTTTAELNNVEVTLDRLQNGQSGKLGLSSAFKFARSVPVGGADSNGLLEGKTSGSFDFTFDSKLLPQNVKGTARLDLARAEGSYADLTSLGAVLEVDTTPTELRQASLRFERGGQRLGQLLMSGPLDLQKSEARLKLVAQSIDHQVLNLIGAPYGLDFGSSVVNATNVIDLSRNWTFIAANGKWSGRQLTLRQAGRSTPALNLDLDYQAQINLTEQTAILQKLTLLGRRNDKDLLTGSLDRPMNVTWAPKERGFTESTLQFALKDADLAEWRAWLGTNDLSGRLNLQTKLVARRDAKALSLELSANVQELAVSVGTNRLSQAGVAFSATGGFNDFRIAEFRSFQFRVEQENQTLVSGSGSSRYDLKTQEATAQVATEAPLPRVLAQAPLPGLSVSNGLAKFSSAYTWKAGKHSANGSLALVEFTGRYADYQFEKFHAAFDYSFDFDRGVLQLYRGTLKLQQGFNSGGTLDVAGKFNLTNRAAQVSFKAIELNQNAVQSFLAPALGENKLVSVSINGGGTANYDPKGDSTLQCDLRVANWVVQDAQRALAQTPLSLRLELDGLWREPLLELRQCLLSLAPTERAKNQARLQAKLDLSRTNGTPSRISLAAESIDLTPYYNLFASKTNVAVGTGAPPQTQIPDEPAPIDLPFRDLTAGVKIDRLFLREVAISSFLATAKIQRSHVVVDPFRMSLNGAPVDATADLNFGVPGYAYDFTFRADRVPVEPLANSFSTERAGYFKGDLLASGRVKGAGVTGSNLRKSLTGQVALSVTNMNLEIITARARRLVEPVALVLGLNDLLRSPLSGFDAQTTMGEGRIQLTKAAVVSDAFRAETQGIIPIADVLTNSPLNLPVNLSLRRSLAEKANLVPLDAPTNAAYVSLPHFVQIRGTLGTPKTETDKLVIAGLLGRSAAGLVPKAIEKVGNFLQGVGNPLGGQATPQPSGASTNKASAPPSANSMQKLIQGVGGLLGGPRPAPAATNPPATPTPPR